MQNVVNRRTFIAGVTLAGCSQRQNATPTASSPAASGQAPLEPPDVEASDSTPDDQSNTSGIATRNLGLTGEKVSMLGVGGYHLGIPSEAEAIRIMHRAIDEGATFFDNCWDYHDGESERRMGKALADDGKRQQVFLMTKIDGRNKAAAIRQLEDSLHRLRTDHIDLVQIHEVIRERDPQWVFGPDGAMEALLLARKAGKLRFIGFTGHKAPSIHLHMLRVAEQNNFRFDTVQMPLNVMDPHFKSFEAEVLPVLNKNQIGVLGMKPMASGDILESGVVTAQECLRYALSLPTSVVITGIDSMPILEQALEVAQNFEPLDDSAKQALLEKTRQAGTTGKLEAFKTSERFDATRRNPHWLTGGTIDPETKTK